MQPRCRVYPHVLHARTVLLAVKPAPRPKWRDSLANNACPATVCGPTADGMARLRYCNRDR
jgi:hypothetical protein